MDFLGLANHTGIFFANSPCYISSAVFNCCCHGRCKQTTLIIRDSHGRDQPTINAHDGTIPASFKVNPKSIPCWKTLRGKVTVNVLGVKPLSDSIALATSNSVVSTGKVLINGGPEGRRSWRRDSECEAVTLGCCGLDAAGGVSWMSLPSRKAFSRSACNLRASCVSLICCLTRSFACTSSSFSRLRFSVSLSCSLLRRSSFSFSVSCVFLRRIASFFFASCWSAVA